MPDGFPVNCDIQGMRHGSEKLALGDSELTNPVQL